MALPRATATRRLRAAADPRRKQTEITPVALPRFTLHGQTYRILSVVAGPRGQPTGAPFDIVKGIVRSHAKVRAAISNARTYLDLKSRGEDFSTLVWALLGGKPIQADYSVSKTTESEWITKASKRGASSS
jgi:hypothetical protein